MMAYVSGTDSNVCGGFGLTVTVYESELDVVSPAVSVPVAVPPAVSVPFAPALALSPVLLLPLPLLLLLLPLPRQPPRLTARRLAPDASSWRLRAISL